MKEEGATPRGRRPRQKEQPLIYETATMIYRTREVTTHHHHDDIMDNK
jgi:hypothetical protein